MCQLPLFIIFIYIFFLHKLFITSFPCKKSPHVDPEPVAFDFLLRDLVRIVQPRRWQKEPILGDSAWRDPSFRDGKCTIVSDRMIRDVMFPKSIREFLRLPDKPGSLIFDSSINRIVAVRWKPSVSTRQETKMRRMINGSCRKTRLTWN